MKSEMRQGKSEIRNPKSEGRPKSEIRKGDGLARSPVGPLGHSLLRASGFGFPLDFGFRISDLVLGLLLLLAFVPASLSAAPLSFITARGDQLYDGDQLF